MDLKKLFTFLSGLTMVVLLGLSVTVFFLFQNHREFKQSAETRFESLLIAKEWQQISDNLTRYCRSYIATNQEKWRQKYNAILENNLGNKSITFLGPNFSNNKIKSLSFNKSEQEKLAQIKTSSRYLLKTEAIAFHAMEGLFQDQTGAFTLKREPDPKMAHKIMFDQNYITHKVKMSIYIDTFFSLLQKRTQAHVDKDNKSGEFFFASIIALIILISGLSILSFLMVRLKIIRQMNQLKESEEKYKIIFENNADAILLIDKNLSIDCNLSALKMFAYPSKANFLKLHPSQMSPKRQADGMLSSEKSAKMMGIAYEKGRNTFEWTHKRANGESFPVRICLTRIPYQNKGILYAVCHDLSEHKLVEKAFQASEKRFELAMSVANDGIWDWNIFKNTILFDARYYTMTGYEYNEYQNTHDEWQKRVHPDDLIYISRAMDNFIHRKSIEYDVEFRFLCKNGAYLWIRSRGKIVDSDEMGRPIRIVGTHADIDAHKKAKEKLYQSEILKKTILQNIPGLLWVKDVNGIYLACNPAVAHLLNRRPVKIIGKTDFDFFEPRVAEIYTQQDKNVLQKNTVVTTEIIRINKDNQKRLYEMTCSSVKSKDGKLIGVLGTTHDITKRKENETALIEAQQRAETANRAKSEFLANMSHEIRTPMNAILGFTEILMRLEKDTKKIRYIETINTSGQALLSLINDILDLSRIESGKMELQDDLVSIASLCVDLEGLFSGKVAEKGLSFSYHIDDNTPKILILDEARIRQVLINLVGNAIKFTHQGAIKINVDCQPSTDHPHDHVNLTLMVADTGIGIPKDQQDNVFHSFEQVKGQKETLYGGTGLGLAITLKIMALMQGDIFLKSEEGVGTEFYLSIPNVKISTSQKNSSELTNLIDTKGLVFSSATLLVVDDVDYNREILENYLLDWGFKLHFACNGKQACEKVKALHPDLILLDMKMPVMNGYEAASILKADESTTQIPIIAVTAFALNRDEAVISQLCDGYLRKPVNRNELISELIKFLPHSQHKNKKTTHDLYKNVEVFNISAALLQLPDELRGSLKQAIEQVDIETLEKLQLVVSAQNTSLAETLQQHIDNFQYEELLNLFG